MGLTIARDTPAFGVYFSSYEICKGSLTRAKYDVVTSSFLAGGMAGVLSFALLNPIDVVKSCRQMQPSDTPAANTTIMSIIRTGLKEDGPAFFMRGLVPSSLR